MNRFLQDIYNYIIEHKMIDPADRLVIGLSGGADSVCLLLALCELAERLGTDVGNFFAVHVNHMIRGEDADRDEDFCRMLCDRLGVHFSVYRKDIKAYAEELHCTVEEAGRKFRYECFHMVAEENDCSKIAVAHNKNDTAETVLFHIIRGSGLKGMAGIPPVRGDIVRPLLGTSRNEIEEYLALKGENFCVDATNLTTEYDRNKIRHIILPAMEQINGKAVSHICQMADEARESYAFIHDHVMEQYAGSVEETSGKTVELAVSELFMRSPVLQEHLIHEAISDVAGRSRDITRQHVMSVVSLLYQDTGKSVMLPYGIRARRSYDRLIISNVPEKTTGFCIDILENGVYDIPDWGSIEVEHLKYCSGMEISKKRYTKMFDYDKIKGNLCIRTPEEGDFIAIDDRGNTKKLSRVFIDNKIDRECRSTWPVLACGHEIIWVLGLRYNVSYGIDENTTHILYMKCERKGE